ncbi:hypothetical protein KL86DES1_20113 [uncultured Desulfovibrio sp.]|uniref:Uncharacterized protein n=1 Tax=uncultured Desulfovibrio sp. TaxID=167968 RepID=A0A212L276_9BACT|nr:hypothetical protein KL86DES1_20113 [uncultured Desulfovibrio sp.]
MLVLLFAVINRSAFNSNVFGGVVRLKCLVGEGPFCKRVPHPHPHPLKLLLCASIVYGVLPIRAGVSESEAARQHTITTCSCAQSATTSGRCLL